MPDYRLVEHAPADGKRYGKPIKTTLYKGPDKDALKAAIDAWCAAPRKPWAEIFYYHGIKRVYAYEL